KKKKKNLHHPHNTGDDQRLQTVQGMTRDCGHSTGDDQRLRTQYRR
ncbi:unnamed protein product, partial [Staurois parvus]